MKRDLGKKGGVEHAVGYARRNFLAGIPAFKDWDELNAHLMAECERDAVRTVVGQSTTILAAWEQEQGSLIGLSGEPFSCYTTTSATLNGYSQATFETNGPAPKRAAGPGRATSGIRFR